MLPPWLLPLLLVHSRYIAVTALLLLYRWEFVSCYGFAIVATLLLSARSKLLLSCLLLLSLLILLRLRVLLMCCCVTATNFYCAEAAVAASVVVPALPSAPPLSFEDTPVESLRAVAISVAEGC